MKPTFLKVLSFLSAVLVCSGVAVVSAAETNAPALPPTLDDLVAEALEKNPELIFYRAEIAAARGAKKTAATVANPELATQFGNKRVRDSAGALTGEGLAWSVSVLQPFEWPGRIGLRKAIANRDLELAELGLAHFRATLTGQVRGAAYEALVAREKFAAAQEVAERLQALLAVLVQRDPAGVTPVLETRIIEASAMVSRRRATLAAQSAQSATLSLNLLLGRPAQNSLLVGKTPLEFVSAPPTEALLAAARTNNFDLRIRQAELAQQGFKVSLAQNEKMPAVSVGPMISQERVGGRETTVGIGLSLPLPLWNRNTGNIEAAQARQQQAEVSLLVAQRQIERQVLDQALAYEAKLGEINHWHPNATQEFQKAAELADRHYRLGAVPIATYVELQKQYVEAVEAALDTRREALAAGVQLELLTGLSLHTPVPTKGKD